MTHRSEPTRLEAAAGRRRWQAGNDAWIVIDGVALTRWDQWMLAVLVAECGGDWAAVRPRLRERRMFGLERDDTEAKLSHLDYLQRRLERIGSAPEELLRGGVDPSLRRKACEKILRQVVTEADKSPAMRDTPRRRLVRRAWRGHWTGFPSSPAPFEAALRAPIDTRAFHPKGSTFALARKLRAAADRLRPQHRRPADRLALGRACLTAVLDAMHRADDSFGTLGDLFLRHIQEYLDEPWRSTGIAAAVYYRDFLELAVWEDYGLMSGHLDGVFADTGEDDAALVDSILRTLRDELLRDELDYQAEKALTLLGELRVARGNVEHYVGLAEEMGSREWQRIEAMADSAWRGGRHDVAGAVFAAADQPGWHREYLANACLRLTGAPPGGEAGRRLRLVRADRERSRRP